MKEKWRKEDNQIVSFIASHFVTICNNVIGIIPKECEKEFDKTRLWEFDTFLQNFDRE